MDIRGKIFNTQHYSIRDGHGIRTVVFLKGCPASCVWCCNPESQGYDFDLYHVERFCAGCGRCEQVCPNSAISVVAGKSAENVFHVLISVMQMPCRRWELRLR